MKKLDLIFNTKNLAAFFLLVINLILFPKVAEAERPATAWRTRSFDYSNVERCVKAGLNAMEYARLNGRRSDNFAVYGTSSTQASNVICLNNGSYVTIFCSGDYGTYGTMMAVCTRITKYMEGDVTLSSSKYEGNLENCIQDTMTRQNHIENMIYDIAHNICLDSLSIVELEYDLR